MAKGLVIPLTADIRKFIKGMRLSADAVDAIGDEFEDVERKSDDTADQMVRDYERAFDRLERAADDADLDLDVSDGIKSAEGSAKVAAGTLAGEVVDEFVENWGEAVRSGDYASAVRETLSQLGQIGGAVGGPAGAVIGGAVALGLTTAFDAALREGQLIQEAVTNIFDQVTSNTELSGKQAAAAFRRGFVDEAAIDEQIVEATGAESVVEAWQEVGRIAAQTGVDQTTVTQALLGQFGAVQQVARAQQRVNDAIDEAAGATETVVGNYGELLTVDSSRVSALKNQNRELDALLGTSERQLAANESAAKVEQDRRGVLRDIRKETEATKKAVETTPDIEVATRVDRKAYDAFASELKKPKTVNVTADVYVRATSAKVQRLMDEGVF